MEGRYEAHICVWSAETVPKDKKSRGVTQTCIQKNLQKGQTFVLIVANYSRWCYLRLYRLEETWYEKITWHFWHLGQTCIKMESEQPPKNNPWLSKTQNSQDLRVHQSIYHHRNKGRKFVRFHPYRQVGHFEPDFTKLRRAKPHLLHHRTPENSPLRSSPSWHDALAPEKLLPTVDSERRRQNHSDEHAYTL
jgi:hypothetical protein